MSKPVVVLDPGHGGYDPGAVAFGLQEKELNLKLALETAKRLSGVKVLLTRDRDVFVSLANRVAFSSRAGADLFLSLHANAGGGRGFESFVCSNLNAGHAAVKKQESIHKEVMAALSPWNIIDRGMKRAAFYVLRNNPRPAVLIESLFIDNEREAGIWREPGFPATLAKGVVKGVYRALGLPAESEPVEEEPAEVRTLYTVQVGAFAYITNARRRLEEAKRAGFADAFIYRKEV